MLPAFVALLLLNYPDVPIQFIVGFEVVETWKLKVAIKFAVKLAVKLSFLKSISVQVVVEEKGKKKHTIHWMRKVELN